MSSNRPEPLVPSQALTPSMRLALLTFLVVLVGGWLLSFLFGKTDAASATVPPISKSGTDNSTDTNGDSSHALNERLDRIEASLSRGGSVSQSATTARSQQAVQQVKREQLMLQSKTCQRYLGQLKDFQSRWVKLEAALLNTDGGRKLASSPNHFAQAFSLWQRPRPETDQLVTWERQLNALTRVIPSDNATEPELTAVTDEFVEKFQTLQDEIGKQADSAEEQILLLESLQRETSALPVGTRTLAAALEAERLLEQRAEIERMNQIRETARKEAETARAKELAQAEQQLAQEQMEAKKQEIERQRLELAEAERLKQQEHEATLAGLQDASKVVDETLKWAQLERQMNRDMPQIRSLLMPFLADGFQNRTDDKKGPASLSVIKGYGALEDGKTGLGKLFFLACGNNDRPKGGMPEGVGGHINQQTNVAQLERAQEFLIKYGDLMVRKGLLAE